MCGIVGIYNYSENEKVNESLIQDMCMTLKHRGPDDHDVYLEEFIGLGHTRLSIIDLSNNARQPMSNEDGTVWVVFNGEIYNFQELQSELINKGHRFKSNSDTEVILHSYEEFGTVCVQKFRGMFSFAIWDKARLRLVLARDRFGEKPLFYTSHNGSFLFASEIKAILAQKNIPRRVNVNALDLYLTFQYVPAPETLFEEIYKVPPAHLLIFENGKACVERYWNIDFPSRYVEEKTEREIADELLNLLRESVRLRMISDVPLGAFLSGGIDSSLVVALMAEQSHEPVKTFSIGFHEDRFNELPYAKIVADHFKTDHHEFMLTPNAIDILPKLIWFYNEPFGDSSAIPTFYVSQITREHVKVALSGDGGDELFGGYARYLDLKRFWGYERIPEAMREMGKWILPDSWEYSNRMSFFDRLINGLKIRLISSEERNYHWLTFFSKRAKEEAYSMKVKQRINLLGARNFYDSRLNEVDCPDRLNRLFFLDLFNYLPGDLLVKVDIASMANSLEVRTPFLDHRIAEYAATIPSSLKIRNGTTKYILKKVGAKILPQEVFLRGKSGFAIPIDHWFRTDLRQIAYDILLNEKAEANVYFQRPFIKQLLDEHQHGINHGAKIWLLLNFYLWHRMFIEGKDANIRR